MGWQRHLLHAGTDAAPKMNPFTYALTGAACYRCRAAPIDGIGLIFPRCSNGGTIYMYYSREGGFAAAV